MPIPDRQGFFRIEQMPEGFEPEKYLEEHPDLKGKWPKEHQFYKKLFRHVWRENQKALTQ